MRTFDRIGNYVCADCEATFTRAQVFNSHRAHVHPKERKQKVAWSKGLTKESHPALLRMSTTLQSSMKGVRHPQSEETKQHLSLTQSRVLSERAARYRRGNPSWMERTFAEWLTSLAVSYGSEIHFRDEHNKKSYYADFVIEDKKLVIELDGNQHKQRAASDAAKDNLLRGMGYEVIRISHAEYKARTRVDELRHVLGV